MSVEERLYKTPSKSDKEDEDRLYKTTGKSDEENAAKTSVIF